MPAAAVNTKQSRTAEEKPDHREPVRSRSHCDAQRGVLLRLRVRVLSVGISVDDAAAVECFSLCFAAGLQLFPANVCSGSREILLAVVASPATPTQVDCIGTTVFSLVFFFLSFFFLVFNFAVLYFPLPFHELTLTLKPKGTRKAPTALL